MNYKALEEFCINNNIEYKKDELMKNHTSFKIGGPVDIFISPRDEDSLCDLLKEMQKEDIPYFILGKGSNLLVSDKGIRGAVISLAMLDDIAVKGNEITAGAGASLCAVCVKAQQSGLAGLEFAYGIPGAVGGAIYMNAGAYGGEMSQVVKSACYVTPKGEKGVINADDMALGYRTSVFKGNGLIITSVTFELEAGAGDEIQSKMDDFMGRRKAKQPLEYPSAGSTFKRPEGHFAGALIEKNNLKSTRVGGAMVSEKHAGFNINYDNATATDVKGLMTLVTETVLREDGVTLEPEVIFVGEE